MNSCILAHSGQKEEDLAREEYFASLPERRAQNEQRESKKAEQEKFYREWWDLDEQKRAAEQRKQT